MGKYKSNLVRETLDMEVPKVQEVLYKKLEEEFDTYMSSRCKEFEYQTHGLMDEEYSELLIRQYNERESAVNKIMHNEINKFMLRAGFYRDHDEINYLLVHWKDIWSKHTAMVIK